MENKKSYYAIIPANVRYCKNLTPNAKLMYGEITALCNEKGFCWASNNYFADLYHVSKVSISKWINQLKYEGFIEIEIDQKAGNPRKLYLNTSPTKVKDLLNKSLTPIKQKFKHNNTSTNTLNNTSTNNDFSKTKLSFFDIYAAKEEKKERKNSAKKKEIIYPFNDQDFIDAWELWKTYKKEQFNFTYKGTISEQSALKQLADKSDDNKVVAIWVIRASISNGWMGLFKPNNYDNKKNRGSSHTDEELAAALDRRFADGDE